MRNRGLRRKRKIDCALSLSSNVGENEENGGKNKIVFVFFFHTLKGKIVERYDERRKGKVSKTNDSFFLSMVSATQEDNERDRREATMRKTKETNKTSSAL